MHKFPYVSVYKILHQANGVFKCNSRGSHKWTRGGQQLDLSNNALSWVNAIFCNTQEIRVFCTRCRTAYGDNVINLDNLRHKRDIICKEWNVQYSLQQFVEIYK